MKGENVTILGGAGKFGSLFYKLLKKEGAIITLIDIVNIEVEDEGTCFLQSNLLEVQDVIVKTIKNSQYILICLHDAVAFYFLENYAKYISREALVIDILSIKSKISKIYLDNNLNAVSLNPMFGPDLGFEEKITIVVEISKNVKSLNFLSLLKQWGTDVKFMTADKHDRITSIVQIASHISIMVFGIILKRSEFSLEECLDVSTPPFTTLASLFVRLNVNNLETYWEIQSNNPYAREIREEMIENLIRLDNIINNRDLHEFMKELQIKKMDDEPILKLSELCASIFKTMNSLKK